MSETGLGLVVLGLRDSDEGFFGIKGPVCVTLGLPTGIVGACGVAARYAKGDGGDERGGILCLRQDH